ncbi:hypothetical protein ABH930_002316 [Kitasatospora sp. GAS204A]|uniref:hypothetical protein n=1 Tax=unclassified Kitasatospora TaxID=2633591 RepID=UPI002474F563|nr:hypothetical protein [Kitasatospora sp. GAS204B]MDH6115821.1 hypothetical protein [Kitasatospora sp. GAS204B]
MNDTGNNAETFTEGGVQAANHFDHVTCACPVPTGSDLHQQTFALPHGKYSSTQADNYTEGPAAK